MARVADTDGASTNKDCICSCRPLQTVKGFSCCYMPVRVSDQVNDERTAGGKMGMGSMRTERYEERYRRSILVMCLVVRSKRSGVIYYQACDLFLRRKMKKAWRRVKEALFFALTCLFCFTSILMRKRKRPAPPFRRSTSKDSRPVFASLNISQVARCTFGQVCNECNTP